DDCYANGFTGTISANFTVNSLNTKAASPAAAGGGFTCASSVTITCPGGFNAGTTSCLTISGGMPIVVGDATGGSSSNTVGIVASASSPEIHGNAYPGTGVNAFGGNIQAGAVWYGNSYSGGGRPGLSLAYGATQIGDSIAASDGSHATIAQQAGVHIGRA